MHLLIPSVPFRSSLIGYEAVSEEGYSMKWRSKRDMKGVLDRVPEHISLKI
jgi:hypothetical protein